MAYSLTNNSGGAVDLGVVTDEDINKDAQLFQMPLPATDSSGLVGLDLFGATKTITIKGKYVGTAISTFVAQIQGLVSGTQNIKTYVSDTAGSLKVLVQNVRWNYETGVPNVINYELSMLEAGGLT